MPAFVNLTGHHYGRWTVLKEVGRKHGGALWLCLCECGTEREIRGSALRNGDSLSCGCLMREKASDLCKERATHKKSKTKVHYTWVNMLQRCGNPKAPGYQKYGAKGIKVCERWQTFENFLADMGDPPTSAHTIERIDSKGHYEPNNCRWATQVEQQNNRSSNRLITAFGKTQTLQKWSRESGFTYKTILRRLELGWAVEKALTTKPITGRNQFSA